MDTVTDFTGRLTPALNITRFVIAGLSKVSEPEVYLYPVQLHTIALSDLTQSYMSRLA